MNLENYSTKEFNDLKEKIRIRKLEIAKEISEQIAPKLETLREEYKRLELENLEKWIVHTIENGMDENVKKSATTVYNNKIEKWEKLELSKFVNNMRHITRDNKLVDLL